MGKLEKMYVKRNMKVKFSAAAKIYPQYKKYCKFDVQVFQPNTLTNYCSTLIDVG